MMHDVVIVGGGPVGLYLALALAQRGLAPMVLEQRDGRSTSSRAIGIHPPGLSALAHVGVADRAIERGVRIRKGAAYGDGRFLGEVSFAGLGPPYPFVLSLPQYEVEALLDAALTDRAGEVLHRARVLGCRPHAQGVRLTTDEGELDARFVVACDGKRSTLRDTVGIRFVGGPYPDSYAMGDFADDTELGPRAGIFLGTHGLVESFPLPNDARRWVARLEGPEAVDVAALVERVQGRTGQRVRESTCTMHSTFTAEAYLADTFVRGRVVLAGDAAHVLSPIGGQGLNLGWLDALALAEALPLALAKDDPTALRDYAETRRLAARRARRRAEVFMGIGRPSQHPRLRDALVRCMLTPPLSRMSARLFSMASEKPWRKAG